MLNGKFDEVLETDPFQVSLLWFDGGRAPHRGCGAWSTRKWDHLSAGQHVDTLLAGGHLCILLFVSSSDASFETFQDGSISQDIAVKNFISNVLMIFKSEESKSARGRFSSAQEAWWLWWW
uniref:Uncharacterized protein n=1 Tax=Populus trichocarpa TaxID=3694 RepID=A0A2K1XPT3_POPTR